MDERSEAEPTEPHPKPAPALRERSALAAPLIRRAALVHAAHRRAVLAAGVFLVGLIAVATWTLVARSGPSEPPDAPTTESRVELESLEAMKLCDKHATRAPASETPDASAPETRIVSGRLDGRPLGELLRQSGLAPTEIYRVRQAFAGVDGYETPRAGRFVASLDPSGGVDAFQLVVSSSEIYQARLDPAGRLTGQRATEPAPVRTCFGSFRFGRRLATSIEASPFEVDILDVLADAFGDKIDLEHPEAGAGVKVITREIVADRAFAGYDGILAAEYQPANSGVSPLRVYGFDAELESFAALRAAIDLRLASLSFSSLLPPVPDPVREEEDAEPVEDEEDGEPAGATSMTVSEAAKKSCSTRSVAGLSRQIIAEMRCLDPDSFTRIPARKNLAASSHVFLYLERPARDRLLRVLDAHPERTMTINSALRTIAQQVLLSKWGERQRCGVRLAASPGESNHESGLALDVHEASTGRKALEKEGFRWFGPKDPVHFDYQGKDAVDHRGLDVRAFQRLWTRNHPEAPLEDNGRVDPHLLKKIGASPAGGFPIGARCDG